MTTDVQNVDICIVEGTRNLIQCRYVNGSNAHGCAYTILADGVGIENGTILRSNAEGMIVELADDLNFIEMVAYDWESDGTTGTLPVQVNSSSTTICPVADTTTDSKSDCQWFLSNIDVMHVFYIQVHLLQLVRLCLLLL